MPNSPTPDTAEGIASVDQVSEAEWGTLLPLFADASLYQTWAYGAVRWGEGNLSHLVLRRAGTVVALAQLRLARLPVLPAGIAYLRWGPLWQRKGAAPDPSVLSEMLECLRREYLEKQGLALQIIPNVFNDTPESAVFATALADHGFFPDSGSSSYRSFLVDLRPSVDDIRANLDRKWRNHLNRSEKNELSLEVSTGDPAYQRFLELYWGMRSRKQFESSVDVREFAKIQERLRPSEKMTVFTALEHGMPVAACVCPLVGNTAIYVLGATNERARELKAAYFMHWQAMLHLKTCGATDYDLGGANPDNNPGVYEFKKGFGGREVVQVPLHSAPGNVLSRALAAVARARKRRAGGDGGQRSEVGGRKSVISNQ